MVPTFLPISGWMGASLLKKSNQLPGMKDFIEKNTPVLPISGWMGDLLKKSDNMPWWKGTKVFVETTEFHVDTLYDMLDKVCKVSPVL